jgi:hypothetical protein
MLQMSSSKLCNTSHFAAGWPAQVGIIFRQVHEIHGDNCGQDCYSQDTYNPSLDLFTPLPLFFPVTAKVQQRQKKTTTQIVHQPRYDDNYIVDLSKTLLLSRQETKCKAIAFWLAKHINSVSKLHSVNCFPRCWPNLQRMSWWARHTSNRWSSSSTTSREHRRQTLSLLGTLSGFACLPHSTSKRWFEHLNLGKDCLSWTFLITCK